MHNIVVKNLDFSYGKKEVLTNLNMNIEEKRIVSILGLNGSGKSTLIKLISGLLKAKKNMIELYNKDIYDHDYIELSQMLAFVNQLSNELNEYEVIEYLRFSFVNKVKFYNVPKSDFDTKIDSVLNKFNLQELSKKRINELSGGERQLIMICAAILQDTDIIILDEPTSALDIKNQYLVLDVLSELNKQGKTIIFTTHNPNHCLFLNSYTYLLKNGNIVYEGESSEAIKPNVLSNIYGNNICYSKDVGDYNEISFKR